ncbi:hypothetical protein [Oceanivirga salmonicida]|uniref:hypothetical protein n=1 Tax=Oceanivirga salmonicida TaxID=1769291 RepID=UPI0012E2E910|nr:hypothetical protein [Oceanivirga salmonicida]
MKLWMSSEYSVGIGDKLRLARNYVEKVINEKINKKKIYVRRILRRMGLYFYNNEHEKS